MFPSTVRTSRSTIATERSGFRALGVRRAPAGVRSLSPARSTVRPMLFERRCPGCGTPAPGTCPVCLARLGASRPSPSALDHGASGLGLDGLVALWTYGPLSSRLVLSAKNGRRRDLYRGWGALLASEITEDSAGGAVDLVTWVPASRIRGRRRGYDQGRVLARRLAGELGLSCRSSLVRPSTDASGPRSRGERIRGPRLLTAGPCPPHVLLIDDVLTTGGSLAAAAAVLRDAGAARIDAAVLTVVVERGVVGVMDRRRGRPFVLGPPVGTVE